MGKNEKRCDIERQNIETTMRKRCSLTQYNGFRTKWEMEG
jgi:hypothetical protein